MAPKNVVLEATPLSSKESVMLRDESTSGGVFEADGGVVRDDGNAARCERVHRTLKRIVKARSALDLAEAAALREAQELRIWRTYGCASLVEYLERELGYTAREAVERLRIAKVIADLPAIASAMEQGELGYSGVRELTRVATPETENDWLEACQDKTAHEIQALVSGHDRVIGRAIRSIRRCASMYCATW